MTIRATLAELGPLVSVRKDQRGWSITVTTDDTTATYSAQTLEAAYKAATEAK